MPINISSILAFITFFSIVASQTAPGNLYIALYTPLGNYSVVMNNVTDQNFIRTTSKFSCSLNKLYTYDQTDYLYSINAQYYLVFSGLSDPNTTISISTVHNNFQPSYSPTLCHPPFCTVSIQNNCAASINFFNYFDRLLINISGFPEQLTFYVKCDDQFVTNTFQWGMAIMIPVITVLIFIVALYSKAWSLGGRGLAVNIWFVIVIDLAIIIGAVIGYYSYDIITYILTVLSFILGTLGVGICVNEILFLFRFKILMITLFKVRTFKFKILELFSLMVGAGLLIGWYFSNNNILINDIICMCIIVACIKVFKFTSLKFATLTIISVIIIEIVFSTILYVVARESYNSLFLNQYNYPFELQIPTINAVYEQKCAWLPFTSIVFPGMLFSYLRRFDSCRSTNLYLITATVIFVIGGVAWMFLSVISPIEFAFGLVSEPCLIGLTRVFAYRRIEMRVLWDGKFYDEEFSNRQDVNYVLEMMAIENRSSTAKTIDSNLLDGLKEREDSLRESKASWAQSKFLREHQKSNPS